VRSRLAVFAVFSLFVLMMIPAYASVTSMSLEKNFYTINEKFGFVGTLDGTDAVFVIIRNSGGNFKGMLSDPLSTDEFNVIPRPVSDFFKSSGIYNATAFTDDQKEEDGFTIKLEFDGNKLFEVPDFVLQLKTIPDEKVDIEKTISFTASLIDSSINDAVFSLSSAAPTGATIDPSSGKFVWTVSKSQGNIQDVQYNFDIIVTKGAQEDRENITITVQQAYVEPEKEPEATTEPEPLEIPAPFVDESKDPQSYVDRYNNEEIYKEWFDTTYPKYSSIYEAVGLDEPKKLAPFVDPNQDSQHYVDRYNNEITYKEWFDKTYPEMTIYEAVGLDEPVIEEPEFGECGEGTDLVNGICVIVDNSKGGGCLIATATFGSELAPQVQQLRELRDNTILSTESGTAFMTGFNQFYYSFSPMVADLERENPVFKEVVKLTLTPMLSSLSLLNYVDIDSEQEMLGYGISLILLNIGMYAGIPAIIIFKARKYIRI